MTLFRKYNSLRIAKEILDIARKERNFLTPMQLIKLVYLAHAWMLALYKRPLINEDIEAWKYGPVISKLYHAIKHYRGNPVEDIDCENEEIDEESLNIINQVYKNYGNLNGIRLSMITHEKNSPWETAWNNNMKIISNELITDYYQKLASDA